MFQLNSNRNIGVASYIPGIQNSKTKIKTIQQRVMSYQGKTKLKCSQYLSCNVNKYRSHNLASSLKKSHIAANRETGIFYSGLMQE